MEAFHSVIELPHLHNMKITSTFANLFTILQYNGSNLPYAHTRTSTPVVDAQSHMRCLPEPNYPSQPTNVRSYFNHGGCRVHGHPSSGGILIMRSANLVDLQFLSVPRLATSERSSDAAEEDAFCEQMKRLGASWWKDEAEFLRAWHGIRKYTDGLYDEDDYLGVEKEAALEARAERSVVFGWPADGVGVWISRYRQKADRPAAFSMVDFAINMEERIEVMKRFGAEFVEDPELVKELQEPWSLDVYDYYTEEEEDDSSSSSVAESVSSIEG
jgi:hypothetical protein